MTFPGSGARLEHRTGKGRRESQQREIDFLRALTSACCARTFRFLRRMNGRIERCDTGLEVFDLRPRGGLARQEHSLAVELLSRLDQLRARHADPRLCGHHSRTREGNRRAHIASIEFVKELAFGNVVALAYVHVRDPAGNTRRNRSDSPARRRIRSPLPTWRLARARRQRSRRSAPRS